ncbi:TolC family protein [Alloacidobacterium dinghuense]|uniref:TolC family protein n=1 Tax=Alloacidobacterium dinghuense TaxID=2763107 RepID=A0A7G8BK76_9BACT|nr:TolC family protein [Alloacidobacterium dinghuense]QNI32946.1 TolC family protein [Alloacidobacterium dinghuense]
MLMLLTLSTFGITTCWSQQADANASPTAGPIAITLDAAIHRAQANEPAFAASAAESKAASLDRSIARAALLPTATYHNQILYTQPNGQQNQAGQGVGSQPSPRFIANNAVREYASQGIVNETVGFAQFAEVKRASAAAAFADAQFEVARRGLVETVVNLYYSSIAADQKVVVAKRAAAEADSFADLTGKREAAREAAHADVVKAQLEQQQRHRDLADANVVAERAKLELAVLLFPDPRTPYTLATDQNVPEVPTRAAVEAAATSNNPDLRSALAALKQSDAEVQAARAAYLPDLGLNFTYGIDAPQFAVNGPDGVRNLGYSGSVTLDIPVWDWLSTQHKVKQSEIRRDATRVALNATQKRLIANLEEAYSEATAAHDQLASLDQSAQTAAESLRLTKLRYTGGEATVLEVVDTQNALTTAENAREDGVVRYRAALANLQTLTGTL